MAQSHEFNPETLDYDPASPGTVKALLHDLGAAPNRTLGQNFLVNKGALDRIVQVAGITNQDAALEIGPGLGALTCRLVRAAGEVVAIEKDPLFAAFLPPQMPAPHFRVLKGDALDIAWEELGLPEYHVKLVANLPYSVSKPLLRRILEDWRPHLQSATVMVQREVADRLAATPATSAYGPMAIMAQLYARTRRVFDVSPGSFIPPPNVTSSVVHLEILPEPSLQLHDEKYFWRVVNAAFAQRRKQLGNTLRAVVADKSTLMACLEVENIDAQRRGETLSLEEFARLAKALHLASRTESL
jgi:16S rRNA (adenine1518-N6/adenine1519-N6)-dimethyltransferase